MIGARSLERLALSPCTVCFLVVQQYYQSEVNNEYVIRGNAAILKCSIPSFVAEFVQVVGWQDDLGNSFDPDEKNGRDGGGSFDDRRSWAAS